MVHLVEFLVLIASLNQRYSVGACDVVGCKNWSLALRRELGKAVKKRAGGSVECFWVLCVRVSLCLCESVSV